MGSLERLVLLQPPEISERAVRAQLGWAGLDRAVRLLGELAIGPLASFMLAPTPNGLVFLRTFHPDESSSWHAGATRGGREALAIGIADVHATAAVAALTELAVGGSSRPSIEIPARFSRPAGEHDGVLTVTRPPGARPSRPTADLPHPALPAHALDEVSPDSLGAALLWPHVADWGDRITAAGERGARCSVVDDASRSAALEWSPRVAISGIALRDGVTTCSLTMADADFLAAFLRKGVERGAFPVDQVDFQAGDGMFTVVVPFDPSTARFAS